MGVNEAQLRALAGPTPDSEKKTRPAPGTSGKQLTYIDARYVQETLDTHIGPANWQNRFELNGDHLTCGIGILVEREMEGHEEWVWKWDVGTESTIEATKGNYSDAFKRAAVLWGIARDLYDDRTAGVGGFSARPARRVVRGSSSVSPASAAADPLDPAAVCPIHGAPWRTIAAGISKKTGKPYNAFQVCPMQGCDQKPKPGAARYVAPPPSSNPSAGSEPDEWVGMMADLEGDDDEP